MNPYISLAPMEGITTYIFRNALNKYYGSIDDYYSPFLTSKELSFKEEADVLPSNNKGLKLIPQILTNNPDTFFAIEERLREFGYDTVNLNLGCPSGTMVAKGRGAGQLKDTDRLKSFLEEIYSKTSMKVSIKTRIGMFSCDEWEDILKVYSRFPIDRLIIHPRIQQEFYKGLPHIEAYKLATQTLSCPLTYNGVIVSADSFLRLTKEVPGTDNIMIGRGLLANPLLAGLLKGETPEKEKEVFISFHNEILEGYINYMSGDQPVLHKMKELWTFMRDFLLLSDKDMKAIKKCNSVREYRITVSKIINGAF